MNTSFLSCHSAALSGRDPLRARWHRITLYLTNNEHVYEQTVPILPKAFHPTVVLFKTGKLNLSIYLIFSVGKKSFVFCSSANTRHLSWDAAVLFLLIRLIYIFLVLIDFQYVWWKQDGTEKSKVWLLLRLKQWSETRQNVDKQRRGEQHVVTWSLLI